MLHNRYQRGLLHLSEFVRVNVVLTVSGHQIEKFTLVTPRHESIEGLAKRVEAEYAFKNMEESLKQVDEDPEMLIRSFQVLLFMTPDNSKSFLFNSTLGNVLDNGDTLVAIGTSTGLQDSANISTMAHDRSGKVRFPQDEDLETQSLSLETKTFAVLHNMEALTILQEFCIQEFQFEYLLFWLEVEVFRNIAKQNASNTGAEVSISSAIYSSLVLHARYIFFTFLADKAALKLNLSNDVLATLDWPVPKIDRTTSLPMPVRIDMFDEIQDYAFMCLSHFVIPSFEHSSFHDDLLDARQTDSYESSWINPGSHYMRFEQDVNGMRKSIEAAMNNGANVELPRAVQARRIVTNSIKSPLAAQIQENEIPGQEALIEVRSSSRQRLRTKDEEERRGKFIHKRRIQREKKLRHFFGDAPITKDAYYSDAKIALFVPETTNFDESDDDLVPTALQSKVSLLTKGATEGESSNDGVQTRRKKVDKLEDFFGVQKLPNKLLVEQRIVDHVEHDQTTSSIDSVDPVPPTTNDLSAQEKRELINKTKRLKNKLGVVPKENIVEIAVSHSRVPNFNRRISQDSLKDHMTASTPSLVSISNRAKKVKTERDRQRRKLQKLQEFLGERVNPSMFPQTLKNHHVVHEKKDAVGKAITTGEKKVHLKRVSKLQHVFGELPPANLIVENSVEDGETPQILSNLTPQEILLYFLSDERNVEDLLNYLEDIDEEPVADDGDMLTSESSDEEVLARPAKHDSTNSRIVQKVQQASQRRRIGKLTKFFGTPAGAISSEFISSKSLHTQGNSADISRRHLQKQLETVMTDEINNAHPDSEPQESKIKAKGEQSI